MPGQGANPHRRYWQEKVPTERWVLWTLWATSILTALSLVLRVLVALLHGVAT